MPTFARPRRSAAYRTVAARLFPAERFAGIESAAALWPLAATGFSANTSRVRHGLRMTAMGPEGPVMKKLHRSYRRLKNETAHGFKPKRHLWSENVGYPHPRRVIHTYPHRNAIRHIARHYATQHGAAQQKRKTRRSGPSCKNLRSRIAAQQHRRNGKSIQCPSNVTTYLGHTLFVGSALKLFLYFVIMLSNPAIANRNRLMFPIYRNCCFAIARITKMFHHVRNARCVCLIACVCSKNAACRRFILHNERTNVNSC